MTNPSFEVEKNPVLSTFDGSGTLLDSSGPQAFTMFTVPGVLSATITNLGSDVVGEYTDIQVSFTVTN